MSENRAGVRRDPPQSVQADLAGLDLVNTPSARSDPDFFRDLKLQYTMPDQPMTTTPIVNTPASSLFQHSPVGPPVVSTSTPPPPVRERDTLTAIMSNAGPGSSSGPSEEPDPSPGEMDRAGGDGVQADSAMPAWSDLKTKAGKDRKRLPLACIACRRKKIRCSGEKPGCKHCQRSRIPCVYKMTARKAAPRTDYMAMLDKRLKRMEERIIKILPKSEQAATSAVPRAVVRPLVLGTGASASNKTVARKRNAADAFGPDLKAWARAPQSKTADREPDSAKSHEVEEESELLMEGIVALPSKEIQEHLAEVFFDHVYGQAYHLLHKPSYMRKLRSDTLPPVLILSVCAIAARFTTNPRLNSTAKQFMRGEEWASVARDICTRRYDWPNITILTCLLILGLHEFGTCHGGRSWALGGQAIRMAFALHLHKDLEYDPQARGSRVKLSFVDREIRRRTMWACFLMDRFNSSGTDRPMFIREDTMRIPLPVSEKYFQLDMPTCAEYLDGAINMSEETHLTAARDSMGVSAYMIRSISIWGRIVNYINQGGRDSDAHPMWSSESEFARLVQQTEKLLRTLPEAVKYSRKTLEIHKTEKTVCHLLFLHMSIQQNLLFLNQAAVTFSQDRFGRCAPKEFVLQSSAKTFFAANQISDLIRDSEDAQCSISTPFAGYCAFSSTAIHITGLFSGNPAMKTTSEANSKVNVRFLSKMMKYWGMFHWMVENIRTQYRNALDAAQSGGAGRGATSSPILQYADWFNRYPHGVSDPDYMDPAMHRKKEMGEDGVLEQKSELQTVGDFFTSVASLDRDGSRPLQKRKMKMQTNLDTTVSSSESPNLTADVSDQQREKQSDNGDSAQAQGALPLPLYQPPQEQSSQFQGASSIESSSQSNFEPFMPLQNFSTRQPMSLESGFFSTDMLSMNLGRPPDRLMRSLDRQFSLGFVEPDMGWGWNANQGGQLGLEGGGMWFPFEGGGMPEDFGVFPEMGNV